MHDRTCSIEGCEKPMKARGWCINHWTLWRNNGAPEPRPRRIGRSEQTFGELAAVETDDHVLWPLHIGERGYGIVTINGSNHPVHRLALERRTGPHPTLMACHTPQIGCLRHCMNYRHLRWGTSADNHGDMLLDGTSTRGERHGRHKLTADEVREIRRLRATGEQYKSLGGRFNVSPHTIKAAVIGENWSWLT